MSEIENNVLVVKEKAKIEILKKSIQDGLILVQKYEAEVEKRRKLKISQKPGKNPETHEKSPKKQNPKKKAKKAAEKRYKCETCAAAFVTPSKLRIHIRTHTGEKPFKCKICPASFVQNCHLTIHIRTHTGEKPYECAKCDSRFGQKQN